MPTYGEWQQDPDFLQWHTIFGDSDAADPVTGETLFDYGSGVSSRETGYQDPIYLITAADIREVVDDVTKPPQNWEGIGGFAGYSTWSTSYSWGYQLSHPNWNSFWEAESVTRWFRITAKEYFYNPVGEGVPVPEGAVGIDWEGQPYDPGSPWASGPAEIQTRGISNESPTQLRGDFVDSTSPVVPQSDTTVWFKPDSDYPPVSIASIPPPSASTDGANAGYTTLPGAIDLTDLIKDAGWSGRLWTKHSFYESPTDPGSGTGLNNGGVVSYGWGFDDVRIDTMVRPARYRWVFEGTPYRRTFPRDDGLAGGAPRTFPPSRAVQSSARVGGGGYA